MERINLVLLSLGNSRMKAACCGRAGPKADWIEKFISDRIQDHPDLVLVFEGSNPNWIKLIQGTLGPGYNNLINRSESGLKYLSLVYSTQSCTGLVPVQASSTGLDKERFIMTGFQHSPSKKKFLVGMCFDVISNDLAGFFDDVIKIKNEFDFVIIALDARTGDGSFGLDNNLDQLTSNGLKVLNFRVPDEASYKFYKLELQKVVCSSDIDVHVDDDGGDGVTFHDFSVDAVDRHPISMTLKFPMEIRPSQKRPSWFSRKLLC